MPKVDWSSIDTQDILLSMKTVPPVAGPWGDCNDAGGGVKMCGEGMFRRLRLWPEPTWLHVSFVQPSTPGPGWLWSAEVSPGKRAQGFVDTAKQAMEAADSSLLDHGWRIT